MNFQDDDLVPIEIACEIIGGTHSPINRSTFYRLVNTGKFPPPIKIGPNISRVRVGTAREYVAAAERGEVA